MFNINEVKSWAKKHGFIVKKQGEGYVWSSVDLPPGDPEDIGEVAKKIFNKITDDKFVDHQKNYVPTT